MRRISLQILRSFPYHYSLYVISCFWKTITFEASSREQLVFQGSAPPHSLSLMAILFSSQRFVKTGFLWAMGKKTSKALSVQEIPTVCDFPDVFRAELQGMPPERDLEFRIYLLPGTRPIYIAPYRLAPLFQEELKKQLDDLLSKQLIKRSVSPWGAPVLFTLKKDGSWRMCDCAKRSST